MLRSPRFTQAVVACVLGVGACGVALALAGPTPRPPADPLDALPGGLVKLQDTTCTTDVLGALAVSTTEEPVAPTKRVPCWHIAVLQSNNETGNQLAERLAKHYETRGFSFSGTTGGQDRAYYGTLPVCGTVLSITSGLAALGAGPGSGVMGPGGATQGLPGLSGLPGLGGQIPGVTSPDPDAAAPTTDTTDPTAATPDASTPSADPFSATQFLMPGDQKPGMVIVSVQQTKVAAPRSAAGRC
jgi:hypothetical protein